MSELDRLIAKTKGEKEISTSSGLNKSLKPDLKKELGSFLLDKPNKTKQIYIDEDIHEVLGKLKSTSGVSIGIMANSIMHEWIKNNKELVNELLKTNNKYLM
ncbi:MAG: hypothetical protein ACPGSD_12120 [Flavobacteriales bacterium]|jgi:hypothetical protein